MKTSETYEYNECISTAGKLDLISSIIELMESAETWTIDEDEYTKLMGAAVVIDNISTIVKKRAKTFCTIED